MAHNGLTETLLKLWLMARTRLTQLMPGIAQEQLLHKLHPNSNSVGHLLRHIAEVEQLFAKNVFGLDIKVKIQTVGPQIHDRGQFTNLGELIQLLDEAQKLLKNAIENQMEEDWRREITTAEFGTVTKAEALGRIISHTAYHAGQIGIILKYGK